MCVCLTCSWRQTVVVVLAVGPFLISAPARAWDYEGHRIVNRLALASLPTNFPSFALTSEAEERIQFLSGEADRWRNTTDLPLKHFNNPDHFLDLENLADYGLTPETVSHFRYEFVAQMAAARAAHPEKFPAIDPLQDADRTKALIGFLPWTITEYYSKLKSEFSYLKVFEELGTPEEIANARANVLYTMGVMGHFVGDASQPLHTTRNYNGWVMANPHGYTTRKSFHQWIDGGFIAHEGITAQALLPRVQPAKMPWDSAGPPRVDVFPVVMAFLVKEHEQVEPLYQLEKDHKLSPGEPGEQEGRDFIEARLLEAGQFLADLWFAAWHDTHPDNYLRRQLLQRQEATATHNDKP